MKGPLGLKKVEVESKGSKVLGEQNVQLVVTLSPRLCLFLRRNLKKLMMMATKMRKAAAPKADPTVVPVLEHDRDLMNVV